MMKRLLFISILFIVADILTINISSRSIFYAYYEIWLPSYCKNFEFISIPDLHSLFGNDGAGAKAEFEIDKENIEKLITSIAPQSLWLRYDLSDSSLKSESLEFPNELPKAVKNGEIQLMLYSSDTKGDFYNIWLRPLGNGVIKISISMTFT